MASEEHSRPEKTAEPVLALEMNDVGKLDTVLRGYYLRQIKRLKKRKDRKLARQLLENHLILPKSRQRTSKDAAYIKEILGIDRNLLQKLEEYRLIRTFHKSGTNPIYEISHDTLVEPILAERSNREAILGFIKRTWKYIALLLLLWFLLGMMFEDQFELIPEPERQAKGIEVLMEEQTLGISENTNSLLLSLPPVLIDQELKPADSILIKLPLNPFLLSRLRSDETTDADSDTISIKLGAPIEVPVDGEGLLVTYQAFSNVVVPLAYTDSHSGNADADRVYAKVSGNLKMTAKSGESRGEGVPTDYFNPLKPIELELGDTLLQTKRSAQAIPVDFTLRLTDFFEDEQDKNSIRNALGDRPVKLSYLVKVGPAPAAPPPPKVELPSVQGIEVQYSDGTKKFIPGEESSGPGVAEKIHIVAAGETLFSIAKKYGIVDAFGDTSAEPIKKLNGLQSNTLTVGQALRIPLTN
jgi:LysM repeat protein